MTPYMYCKTCNNKISKDAFMCPSCGDGDPLYKKEMIELEKQVAKSNSDSKGSITGTIIVGGLLTIFLFASAKWWTILLGFLSLAGTVSGVLEKIDDIKFNNKSVDELNKKQRELVV